MKGETFIDVWRFIANIGTMFRLKIQVIIDPEILVQVKLKSRYFDKTVSSTIKEHAEKNFTFSPLAAGLFTTRAFVTRNIDFALKHEDFTPDSYILVVCDSTVEGDSNKVVESIVDRGLDLRIVIFTPFITSAPDKFKNEGGTFSWDNGEMIFVKDPGIAIIRVYKKEPIEEMLEDFKAGLVDLKESMEKKA